MEYLRQTIGSAELSGIFEIPPTLRNKRVQVIILPEEDTVPQPDYACRVDFAKGPPLPDSFFDPLPEEDLQAWGM
jgi:hypothetical protein